jgi:hypothetical protein
MKKLTTKDLVTTIALAIGGAIVYAKYYNFSWAVVGSWRSATVVIAGLGAVIFGLSSYDFAKQAGLNLVKSLLAIVAFVFAIIGSTTVREYAFYGLAITAGVAWLIDFIPHLMNSLDEGLTESDSTTFHRHLPMR